mgnify:CR=1 FL=1
MNRLLFIAPVALFLMLVLAFGFGLTRDPSRLPSTLIDKPLPAFQLPGLAAGDAGLSSERIRGEPALLNLFASWCLPCRVEHPLLLKLAGEGVPIYGIDWKEPAADGAAYIQRHGNPFRAIGNDANGRAGIDLGTTGVPETYIVDGKGRVRYKHIGPITEHDWQDVLKPMMDRVRAEAR